MKVSILTACYNCGPWIKKAIQSVISQSHNDWEMLILNDRSTDNSKKIIKSFVKREPRISIVPTSERLYCGGAYNKLAQHARGEICGVLDADDALHKNAMRKVVEAYESTGADFLWTQFWLCDQRLRKLRRGFSQIPKKGKSLLEVRHAFSHWRTFRTSMRDKAQVFDPRFHSAVDKWMGYALEEVGRGVFLDKILYYYRQRVGGLSYKGRANWAKMKQEFNEKRKRLNINPFPICRLK